jgi:hypothetical protein
LRFVIAPRTAGEANVMILRTFQSILGRGQLMVFSVFSDVPDPRQNRYSSWKINSFWQDFFRGEQKNFCLPAPRSASTKRERKVFPSDNFFVLSAVSFSGQQNGSATGAFVSSRSEPISLATLDRDCFIIPVRSLERFLPAGVPVSRLAHRTWCD